MNSTANTPAKNATKESISHRASTVPAAPTPLTGNLNDNPCEGKAIRKYQAFYNYYNVIALYGVQSWRIRMDIFEFAMQMEKDGEKYYRELMNTCKTPGLKKIFSFLADEEAKHYTYIENLQQKKSLPQTVETHILENVKNIFVGMKSEKQGLDAGTIKATAAFIKARDIEEKSRKFYQEKAGEIQNAEAKSLLKTLAKEEQKHFYIMENIIEFISRPEPGNWLENAEWHHLEEY
jgi:rubrerythrin